MVLARELWGDIDALEGDVGCRALVRAHPELVAAVAADRPGGHPIDIDTRDDFERLAADPADALLASVGPVRDPGGR